jgi:hypothetical protein
LRHVQLLAETFHVKRSGNLWRKFFHAATALVDRTGRAK